MKFDDRTIELAAERQATHDDNDPSYMGDPKEIQCIGVTGERHFARCFGLPYPRSQFTQRPQGDGGIDFTIPLVGRQKPLTIDVKTARSPLFLLIKEKDIGRGAEVLVLCRFDDASGKVSLLGWDWRSVMKRMPVGVFGKWKTRNYYRAREQLRPISELCDLLARREEVT